MEFLDRRLVKVSGLNVHVYALSHTPVKVIGPVLPRQELQGDVGIVFAYILQTRFHGCQNDALVTEALLLDEFNQQRDIGAVVGVDTGGPFELDERQYIILPADVQVLLGRAQATGIGHSATSLRQWLGLQLFERG